MLRAEGYTFTVFTPAGSVRLMSDRAAEDYIELSLDTSRRRAASSSATRAAAAAAASSNRSASSARAIRRTFTEDEVLAFLLKELEPFVER